MDKLKETLEKAKQSGKLTLSSADIAASVEPKVEDKQPDVVKGPVSTPVAQEAKDDSIMNTAKDGVPGQIINDEMNNKGVINPPPLEDLMVSIDDEDRDAFLDAIVKDVRYLRTFNLFGGKLTGVLRSRTQEESLAILAYLNILLKKGEITQQIEYSTMLRAAVLACQVEELNGLKYVPLTAPLYTVKKNKDEEVQPGWIDQFKMWMAKPEATTTAIYDELQIFESKYWTMIRSAPDSNFWSPAEST